MKKSLAVVIPAYNEEKTIAETLAALNRQTLNPDIIIVVDNNSTDQTALLVEKYAAQNPNICLIKEIRKGTGYASDAGFRYAIANFDAKIICRIDADSIPDRRWIETIVDYFAGNPQKYFLAGLCKPRTDDGHGVWYDRLVWQPWWRFILIGGAIVRLEPFLLKFGFGGNLAIRREAYEAVGGFAHTDIGDSDEDHALNKAVYKHYGLRGMARVTRAVVYTSTRRIRKIGYWGIVPYYAFSGRKGRMWMTGGVIDIR